MKLLLVLFAVLWILGDIECNSSSASDLITKTKGENLNISCIRFPNDTNTTNSFNFSWQRSGGDHILSNSNQLTILDIKTNDTGNYNCTASNSTASFVKTVTVAVQYKPKINRTGLVSKVNSWFHHNSTHTCRAEGIPTPKITWSKDGHVKLNGTVSVTIGIYPMKAEDFGNYTCTARNELGEDEILVKICRTAFPPYPPTILNQDLKLSHPSLTLQWTKPKDNGRQIIKYLIYQRVEHSNSLSRKVDGAVLNTTFKLNWGVSYEFAVAAENDQGSSNKSKSVIFVVEPEPTPSTTKPTTTNTAVTTKTTPSTLRPASGSDSSKASLYVAIVAGAVALLVIAIVVGFCIKRKRNTEAPIQELYELQQNECDPKKNRRPWRNESIPNTYNSPQVLHPQSPISSEREQTTCAVYANLPCLEEEKEWEFPKNKLHIEKYVGKGAFCVVAQARAEGLGIVAVKIPKENSPDSNKQDLLAEYELMKQLQHHPNIIRLLGAVTMSDPIMVLFEYIPFGDLLGFLRKSRGLNDDYYQDPDVKPPSSLSSKQLLKFAREIADGMAFLAASKIVHRDLAARNVLVGEEETCKITDFGMARDVQGGDIYQKRSKGRLPVKWTAVEALLYGYYTTKSDVWSYGIVLYEIFTIGGRPYPSVAAHNIPYRIKAGYRMPKPAHLDNDIYALMAECWDEKPDRRPTFESISRSVKRLENYHKEIIYMNVYDDDLYSNLEDWDEQ